MHNNGYILDLNKKSVCNYAIESGKLEILKWLYENGYKFEKSAFELAVEDKNNFEIMEWLYSINCEWDESACGVTAYYGNFENLKWSRKNGCPWNTHTCSNAVHSGNLEILKWLYDNGFAS